MTNESPTCSTTVFGSIGEASGSGGGASLLGSDVVTGTTTGTVDAGGGAFGCSVACAGSCVAAGTCTCAAVSRVPGCAFVDERDAHALMWHATKATRMVASFERFNIGNRRAVTDRILCVGAAMNQPITGRRALG